MPFARDLVEREKDPLQAGFVLWGSRLTGAVWVPVREISEYKLRDVKWVAMRHHCDAYEIAKMRVTGLEWADEFTRSMLMGLHAAQQRQAARAREKAQRAERKKKDKEWEKKYPNEQ